MRLRSLENVSLKDNLLDPSKDLRIQLNLTVFDSKNKLFSPIRKQSLLCPIQLDQAMEVKVLKSPDFLYSFQEGSKEVFLFIEAVIYQLNCFQVKERHKKLGWILMSPALEESSFSLQQINPHSLEVYEFKN